MNDWETAVLLELRAIRQLVRELAVRQLGEYESLDEETCDALVAAQSEEERVPQ